MLGKLRNVVIEEVNSSDHPIEGENIVGIETHGIDQVNTWHKNRANRPHHEVWDDKDLFCIIEDVL